MNATAREIEVNNRKMYEFTFDDGQVMVLEVVPSNEDGGEPTYLDMSGKVVELSYLHMSAAMYAYVVN